jgi:hypothetical protein
MWLRKGGCEGVGCFRKFRRHAKMHQKDTEFRRLNFFFLKVTAIGPQVLRNRSPNECGFNVCL